VNPIFTWVRLAQRIPVRIHIDEVAPGVVLSAGMTATVEIDDRSPCIGKVKVRAGFSDGKFGELSHQRRGSDLVDAPTTTMSPVE
jgi:hypothetical protein